MGRTFGFCMEWHMQKRILRVFFFRKYSNGRNSLNIGCRALWTLLKALPLICVPTRSVPQKRSQVIYRLNQFNLYVYSCILNQLSNYVLKTVISIRTCKIQSPIYIFQGLMGSVTENDLKEHPSFSAHANFYAIWTKFKPILVGLTKKRSNIHNSGNINRRAFFLKFSSHRTSTFQFCFQWYMHKSILNNLCFFLPSFHQKFRTPYLA